MPQKNDSAPPPQPKVKSDLDKFGIFKNDGYLRGTEPYTPLDNFVWNEPAHKEKQFLIKVSGKKKNATNNGYFGEFVRTFEGECISDPLQEYRKKQRETKVKFYAGQFQFSNPGKKLLGKGHYDGTFGGHVEAFSTLPKVKSSVSDLGFRPKPKKPFKMKNTKRGSGYGTGDVTFNQYPLKSQPDPIKNEKLFENVEAEKPLWDYYKRYPNYLTKNPFYTNPKTLPLTTKVRPISGKLNLARLNTGIIPFNASHVGKKLGGCKAGCFTNFSKFGTYYVPPERKKKAIKPLNVDPFYTSGTKTSTYKSIIQTNVEKRITPTSYKTIDRVMQRRAVIK